MYEVEFYKDKNGKELVKEYLQELIEKAKINKNYRIKYKKIYEYLELLQIYGTRIGLPVIKHIEENIWELRPIKDRIFFFYWKNNTFILLHCFEKKTTKTPIREIEHAKRNMKDFLERNDINV